MTRNATQKKIKNESWICAWYNKDNTFQIFNNGTIEEGFGANAFKSILWDIFREGENQEYSVFMNDFAVLGSLFPGSFSGLKHREGKADEYLEKVFNYKKNRVRLKNFEVFIPNNTGHRFSNDPNPAAKMVEYFNNKMFNGLKPSEMQKTLGYVLKKYIFFKDISEVLKQDIMQAGRNMWTEDMFNHLLTGNKAGLIKTDCYRELNIGVDEWDLISAYSSVMMNDSMFPIGKVFCLHNEKAVKALNNCLNNGYWFMIYVPKDIRVDKRVRELCTDSDSGNVGIPYYDYLSLTEFMEMDKSYFEELLRIDGVVFYEAQSGRLHPAFINRNNDFFMWKNSCKKGSFEREIAKQCLEVTYGKGMQHREFDDLRATQGFFCDGHNYFQPHMSMHCCSAIRYRILKAAHEAGWDSVTYFDTDSIHGYNMKPVIDKDNDYVETRNLIAGYDNCNIGCWKPEHLDMQELVLAPKQRICLDKDGTWTVRIAGVKRTDIEDYIDELKEKGMTDDLIMSHLRNNGIDDAKLIYYTPNTDSNILWTSREMLYKEYFEMQAKKNFKEVVCVE